MNIFGIGGAELVLILILMLVVAGPQRMIRWAFVLGRYVAVLQRMWGETAAVLQREFDSAGVNVKVPRQIPTQSELRRTVIDAITPVTNPLEEVRDEVQRDLNNIRLSTQTQNKPVIRRPPTPNTRKPQDEAPPMNDVPNGSTGDFGTWGGGDQQTPGDAP